MKDYMIFYPRLTKYYKSLMWHHSKNGYMLLHEWEAVKLVRSLRKQNFKVKYRELSWMGDVEVSWEVDESMNPVKI